VQKFVILTIHRRHKPWYSKKKCVTFRESCQFSENKELCGHLWVKLLHANMVNGANMVLERWFADDPGWSEMPWITFRSLCAWDSARLDWHVTLPCLFDDAFTGSVVLHSLQLLMILWMMNWKRRQTKQSLLNLMHYHRNCLEGQSKTMKYFCQDNQSPELRYEPRTSRILSRNANHSFCNYKSDS
jgi:hypothetical protein